MNDAPPKAIQVSVILVTYNSRRTIGGCLESIFSGTGTLCVEVIIVDNASRDGTLAEAGKYHGVLILRNDENLGYCQANNQGIESSTGKYILLLNPDAMITADYLSEMVAAAESNPETALFAGKILRMDEQFQPVLRDGSPVIDTTGIRLRRNRQPENIGMGQPDPGDTDPGEVFAVDGAVCFCRREALCEAMVEGEVFDSQQFAYKEDVDLAWRLQKLGWGCMYIPKALAYHARKWKPGLQNREEIAERSRYLAFRNRYYLIIKNDSIGSIIQDILPILSFELRAMGYCLLREHHLIGAYGEVFENLPRLMHWRREVQQKGRRKISGYEQHAG